MTQTPKPGQLNSETLRAFCSYIQAAELEMQRALSGDGSALWFEANSHRAQQVREQQIVAELWSGTGPVKVPNGLIHDWIAAAFVARATLKDVLALVQDYANYENVYRPEVIASRLVSRHDQDFQIYLRVVKKKILTVVLDTDHDVHYCFRGRTRCTCRSYTTRIAEVESAGSPKEKVLPPDTGHGFLWRLYSYWQFEERGPDVYLECRAISLTRDVPLGLGWMIEPIIQKLPKESLTSTLEATRHALDASIA